MGLLDDLLRPVSGGVTSPFGPRPAPLPGASTQHKGADYAAPIGTAVRAAAAGTVTFSGVQGGYGNLVILTHPGGAQTYYAHLSRALVSAGDGVDAGQTIAESGRSGNVTGPHLHFEVRVGGVPVDPEPLLAGGGVSVVDAPKIDYSTLPDFSAPDPGAVDEGIVDEYGVPTFSVDVVARDVRNLAASVGLDESAMWALLAIVGIGVLWSLTPGRHAAPVAAWE